MNTLAVLLPLSLALAAAPLTICAGLIRPGWSAAAGALLSALAFAAALWGWLSGGGSFYADWVPSWDLSFIFALDGLATLYILLATGIGFLVIVYSAGYLPLHLAHEGQPAHEQIRFYAFLLLFLGSMVGLVMSHDLILAFVFWDLTAIASYYLIGYDQHNSQSRAAALMALLVTGVTAVCFLIGSLTFYVAYGTFSIPELIEHVEPGPALTTGGLLIALAALAKSAQVPLHFWLPRAMAAPTPVSAYLHSAAMVAAGVFLLSRLYPLLQQDSLILTVLLLIGTLSMAVGGVLALTQQVLKQVLAYSTIAQYGYVVVMLGLGGTTAASAAAFYVLAHALCKCSLFLTAGAVTEATHQDRLSSLGGLWRSMPVLAIASGAAAAGLAALPLTIGFFKDELFFKAAIERGWPFAALALLGTVLTLVYIWRFWSSIFLGPVRAEAHPVPVALVVPVVLPGLIIVLGGIVPAPFAHLAAAAGEVMTGTQPTVELAYHLDTRVENMLALITYTFGILFIIARPLWKRAAQAVDELAERLGPERWYILGLRSLNELSRRTHDSEPRELRWRIATILSATAALVGISLLAAPPARLLTPGAVTLSDLPLLLGLLLVIGTAALALLPRDSFTLVLALSSLGYGLAVVYALFHGPDVAMVATLVETVLTLLLLGALVILPESTRHRQEEQPLRPALRWRNTVVSTIVGIATFAVVWSVLSQPIPEQRVADAYIPLAHEAHAEDIVTAILADFRGLDTLGEITVIVVALIGVAALLRRGRTPV